MKYMGIEIATGLVVSGGWASAEMEREGEEMVHAPDWVSFGDTWDGVEFHEAPGKIQEYEIRRAEAYPSLEEQADMQYWDTINGTTTWVDAIAQVKLDHPKPE